MKNYPYRVSIAKLLACFRGGECEQCRGKGYRLIVNGVPAPAATRANRLKRWQSRPPKRR